MCVLYGLGEGCLVFRYFTALYQLQKLPSLEWNMEDHVEGWIWAEAVVACFQSLSDHLSGCTEVEYELSRSAWPIVGRNLCACVMRGSLDVTRLVCLGLDDI
jgi:hypothetical protein